MSLQRGLRRCCPHQHADARRAQSNAPTCTYDACPRIAPLQLKGIAEVYVRRDLYQAALADCAAAAAGSAYHIRTSISGQDDDNGDRGAALEEAEERRRDAEVQLLLASKIARGQVKQEDLGDLWRPVVAEARAASSHPADVTRFEPNCAVATPCPGSP